MYKLIITDDFEKQFRKLDRAVQVMVKKWMMKHFSDDADPKDSGRPLSADKKGYWRYRIGDYRLLAEIRDRELIIIAIGIAHRSIVYGNR